MATNTDPEYVATERRSKSLEILARERQAFVRDVVEEAGADGVVVALSGGIDSTVSATLAVEALGSDAVTGFVMPTRANTKQNMADARNVAADLGIDHRTIDVDPVVEAAVDALSTTELQFDPTDPLAGERSRTVTIDAVTSREGSRDAIGNLAARVRMALLYVEANTRSKLVLGTGNRTELLVGYVTKYGDGGVDLLPIGDLYKTEVRALARYLDVPKAIREKPPTAGLWEGQTDKDELGAPYDLIDAILRSLVDDGRTVAETAEELGVDTALVARFAERYDDAAHKRSTPPTPTDRRRSNVES